MTFDDMLEALGDFETVPVPAIEAALGDWDEYGPRFRALLHGYVHGVDQSERTERALYGIVHVLGEKADHAAFPDLCSLCEQTDKFDSVYGPDGAAYTSARILTSTFDGNPEALERLAGSATAEDFIRCDALLVLAYLACAGRIAEERIYRFLSRLAPDLPEWESDIWYGYAKAVSALGFAGLAGSVDAAYKRGCIPERHLAAGDFWREVRAAQSAGKDVSGPDWDTVRPIDSAVEQLQVLSDMVSHFDGPDAGAGYAVQEPIRNPLKSVGRNDPCPCGSGRKYKKCCLQAADT